MVRISKEQNLLRKELRHASLAPLWPSLAPLCLPDVVTHYELSQAFPLPPFLHTASNQKLEAGIAWERGREGMGMRQGRRGNEVGKAWE